MPDGRLNGRVADLEKTIARIERKINHLESKIDAPREKNETGVSPQSAATQKDNAAERQALTESKFPPSPPHSNQPNKPWYKTMEGWKPALELIAIPFAIGYAIVTWYQWRDLRRNFETDERAWIAVDLLSSAPAVGQPLKIVLTMSNTGKTFARQVQLCDIQDDAAVGSMTFPQRTADPPDFRECSQSDWIGPSIIAPDSHSTHSSFRLGANDAGLDAASVEALNDGRFPVWDYGQIRYMDIFQKEHWITFCFERLVQLSGPDWVSCPDGNDTDTEPK
jgi:hypothetical protein